MTTEAEGLREKVARLKRLADVSRVARLEDDEWVSDYLNEGRYESDILALFSVSHIRETGLGLVPVEATDAMLDGAVVFALQVQVSADYGWTEYMRDLWAQFLKCAP